MKTKNTKTDTNFPTETIKIEGLGEIAEAMLSNNDSLPISTQEGTKKIPLHRIKTASKKLTILAGEVVAHLRKITQEEVLLYDIFCLEGLDNTLTEDIIITLPTEGIQEGKKILWVNTTPSQNAFGFVLKQDTSDKPILRMKYAQHKEELLYLNGSWQNFNPRSSSGLIGLDISLVGDSAAILAHQDFLLPYDGKTYSQLDYPQLCIIKRLANDWVFDDVAATFTMPNYTDHFLRHGAPANQGQKKTDTMRKIVAFSPFVTIGKNISGAFVNNKNWSTSIKSGGHSDNWGTDMYFDSSKGVDGQVGKVSPNVGPETAPKHVMTTFYVIAK